MVNSTSLSFQVPSLYLTPVREVCKKHHIDFTRLLAEEGMAPSVLNNDHKFVDFVSYVGLLNKGALWIKDQSFGFQVGTHFQVDWAGELAHLIANQNRLVNIYPAIAYLVEAQSRGVHHSFEITENIASHIIDLEPESYLICDQAAQLILTFYQKAFSHLLQEKWKPVKVRLKGNRHLDVRMLEDYFHCPVHVGQSNNAIDFPATLLQTEYKIDLPPSRDVTLEISRFLRNCTDLEGLIYKYIEFNLEPGTFSKEDIAGFLCIHPRVLQSHLSEQGLKFREILNKVRQDKAKALLLNTDDTVATISYLLGYQDSRTFIRAFKSWTGQTPETWRVRK